jgi:hypothetical protein
MDPDYPEDFAGSWSASQGLPIQIRSRIRPVGQNMKYEI